MRLEASLEARSQKEQLDTPSAKARWRIYAYMYPNELIDNDHPDPCAMDYNIIQQFYENAWVSQEFIPNVLQIVNGSAAGTPLADLVYSLCMSRPLSLLRDSMEKSELESVMYADGLEFKIPDVSFVDDVAIPVLAEASNLCHKISKVTSLASSVYASYGMKLNFNPGKSEATVGFYGHKKRLARKRLIEAGSVIGISACESESIRVVPSYQHVGTLSPAMSDISDELSKCVGMMRCESQSLAKNVLRVKSIPLKGKVSVMQAYVLSRGTFQCGTWPVLNSVQYKRFHSCILKIYRDASGNYFKGGSNECEPCEPSGFSVMNMFNDDDIVYTYGFMCPQTILRLARLALFYRIVVKSPPWLMSIIKCQSMCNFKKGWVCAIASDLKWLCQAEPFVSCVGFSVEQWADHVLAGPRAFIGAVRKFCKSPYANIVTQWATCPELKVLANPITCEVCGHISRSAQSHALHLSSKHGIKSKFRRYVDGSVCKVCLVQFWSRERCLNHIRYRSVVCKANHLFRGPVLSLDEAKSLDLEACTVNRKLHASGKRRHNVPADEPCVRLSGPLLPIITARSSSHHPLGFGANYR